MASLPAPPCAVIQLGSTRLPVGLQHIRPITRIDRVIIVRGSASKCGTAERSYLLWSKIGRSMGRMMSANKQRRSMRARRRFLPAGLWSRGMFATLGAQFLSAFGDNALLFAALA